jgi:hypothetical protein
MFRTLRLTVLAILNIALFYLIVAGGGWNTVPLVVTLAFGVLVVLNDRSYTQVPN